MSGRSCGEGYEAGTWGHSVEWIPLFPWGNRSRGHAFRKSSFLHGVLFLNHGPGFQSMHCQTLVLILSVNLWEAWQSWAVHYRNILISFKTIWTIPRTLEGSSPAVPFHNPVRGPSPPVNHPQLYDIPGFLTPLAWPCVSSTPTIHTALGENMWSKLTSPLENGQDKMPKRRVEFHVVIYDLWTQISSFIYHYSSIAGCS